MPSGVRFLGSLTLGCVLFLGVARAEVRPSSNTPDFFCYGAADSSNPAQAKTVAKGEKLKVRTIIPVCAYVWYSLDGLNGVVTGSNGGVGGNYVVDFEIDTSQQTETQRTYAFEVAKVWDKTQPISPPVECKIQINLAN